MKEMGKAKYYNKLWFNLNRIISKRSVNSVMNEK
jgi:hypothetical protein